MASIEQYVSSYITLRDKQKQIAERHKQELAPITEAMTAIEMYLLNQMNELGVRSLPTAAGTPYKADQNSVKLADPIAFKSYIFAPALQAINNYLIATGHSIQPVDIEAINSMLQQNAKWDMVDFRAGKKAILENLEETSQLPPGVSMETFTTVNVRRS